MSAVQIRRWPHSSCLSREAARDCFSRVSVAGVRVRLERGPQTSMPEHALHADGRRTVREHLGRGRVAQHVRGHVADAAAGAIERLTALGLMGSPDL